MNADQVLDVENSAFIVAMQPAWPRKRIVTQIAPFENIEYSMCARFFNMNIPIPPDAVREDFVRSSGPGGQNVNKVSSCVQLRVDTTQLAMTDEARARLKRLAGRKLTDDGLLILKAQEFRTQERNRGAAWAQLQELLTQAQVKPKPRRETKPSRASQARRIDEKKRRSEVKSLRRDVSQ